MTDISSAPMNAPVTRHRLSELEAVYEIAQNLVALWESPTIKGLPRSDRNAAIDETRQALIELINHLARSSTGSEQGNSTSEVAGSNPAAPATNRDRSSMSEPTAHNSLVAGSSPAGLTTLEMEAALRSSQRGVPSREEVARIVDPIGFQLSDELKRPESDGFPGMEAALKLASKRTGDALAKADAILALLNAPQWEPQPRCDHETVTRYDWNECTKCGAILTGTAGWGLAARTWFCSPADAKYYDKHGRLPELSRRLDSDGQPLPVASYHETGGAA